MPVPQPMYSEAMLASSAMIVRPRLTPPTKAAAFHAAAARFLARTASGLPTRLALPDGRAVPEAQLAAPETSSLAATTSFGGCQACGPWAGAMASVVAHMSQLFCPSGIAQPQRLQTAMALQRAFDVNFAVRRGAGPA